MSRHIDCANDAPLSTSCDDVGVQSSPFGLTAEICTPPLPFVRFFFKRNVSIGGVVITKTPQVGQVIVQINEIETRDTDSIYLLQVDQLMLEQ
jgi:hypothetical protein